jgi:hypothetical protein
VRTGEALTVSWGQKGTATYTHPSLPGGRAGRTLPGVEADRLDDGRAHRRDLTGTMTGAAILLPVGALVGLLLPSLGGLGGPAMGALLGALLGAGLGRALIRRHLNSDDFEPERSARAYVGARSPDSDG